MDIKRVIANRAKNEGIAMVSFTRHDGKSFVVLGHVDSGRHDLRMLDEKTEKIAKQIRVEGFFAEVINAGNGNGTSLRKLAENAGLGFIGRSGLLITESHGPDVRLTAIVTNTELYGVKEDDAERGCGDCRECEINCPTDAIAKKDSELCRAYYEDPGIDRCTICVDVCPFQRLDRKK